MINKIKKFLSYLIMSIVSFLCLIPFYVMFVMATQNTAGINAGKVLMPGKYFIENLQTVMRSGFHVYYFNSMYIAIVTVALSVFVSALTGFAFAKYQFKFKKGLYGFILVNMMVPAPLGLIAYVVQMRAMKLSQTHVPLIMVFVATTFGVFWMSQYIKSAVPNEILESARIDGCNEFRIFMQIVIPYIKPALGTLSIIIFMWSWNNYLLPLVMLNKTSLYTIPLGIATLGTRYRTDYGARICGLAIGTIPLLLVFTAGSSTFIKGLTAGAIKG